MAGMMNYMVRSETSWLTITDTIVQSDPGTRAALSFISAQPFGTTNFETRDALEPIVF